MLGPERERLEVLSEIETLNPAASDKNEGLRTKQSNRTELPIKEVRLLIDTADTSLTFQTSKGSDRTRIKCTAMKG